MQFYAKYSPTGNHYCDNQLKTVIVIIIKITGGYAQIPMHSAIDEHLTA